MSRAALSERIYLRLAPRDVAMLRFLIEAYDNLGYVSVVDRFAAVATIIFAPGRETAVRAFLKDIGQAVAFSEIALPL